MGARAPVAQATTATATAGNAGTSADEVGSRIRAMDTDAAAAGGLKGFAARGGAGVGGDARSARQFTNMRESPQFGAAILHAASANDPAAKTLLSELLTFCLRNSSKPARVPQHRAATFCTGCGCRFRKIPVR